MAAEKKPELKLNEESSRFRELPRSLDLLGKTICLATAVFLITYIVGLFTSKYFFMERGTFRGLGLGLMLFLIYLYVPARAQDKTRLPWYDVVLMLTTSFPSFYYAATFSERMMLPGARGAYELIFALMLILGLLEASRRMMGITMPILAGLFLLYPIFSDKLPGLFQGRGYSISRVLEQTYLFDVGMMGSFLDIGLSTIFAFLIFASFLQRSGAQDFFMDVASAILGFVRGGPAKVAVVGSSFMGMLSGSAVANVVTTGSITIPMMKRVGYRPVFAGAVEAVASTGGQLMPPVMGATAFMMADVLEISYWSVAVMAILPAILYYFALFLMVDLEAGRTNLRGIPREELPKFGKTLAQGWMYILPILLLIYLLGFRAYSPETGAMYAIVVTIIVSLFNSKKESRLNLHKFLEALIEGVRLSFEIMIVVGLIGIIVTAVNMTGLSVNLASALVQLAGGNLLVLLMIAGVACYIFGMGLPTIAQYLLLALLVAPAIIQMGVEPAATHMFILYWGLTSHITPPVAPAAFAAASIAKAPMFNTGFMAMKLGITLLLVPFVFVYAPGLLLTGTVMEAIVPFVTCLLGITFLSGSLEGYFFRSLRLWERLLLAVAAILAIIPEGTTDVIGIVLGCALLAYQFFGVKTHKDPIKQGTAG